MEKFHWSQTGSGSLFPVAKPGLLLIYGIAFSTIIFALCKITVLALIGLFFFLFVCYFFRDPDRVIPRKDGIILSPADGKIIFADLIKENPFIEGESLKISIFMNVFNVHVNRVPHEGVVCDVKYRAGKFLNASFDKASEDNELNAVIVETEQGKIYSMVQIAGLIARRIICGVQKGDVVERGSRFGMICFGSRLDVYLPKDTKLDISIGDKVKAGESILGYFV